MTITRREFVTRLGALAAAAGLSQSQLLKITEAMGHSAPWNATAKPKVIWVHGAECTGCSISLLGLFEDVRGLAVQDTRLTRSVDPDGGGISTLSALDLAVGGDGDGGHVLPPNLQTALGVTGHPTHHHRTLYANNADFDSLANANTPFAANIADVLIDFISLEYHVTVMGMGGAQAYEWLKAEMDKTGAADSGDPFVLVVEGAVQVDNLGGFWGKTDTGDTSAPWCAIGESLDGTAMHRFDNVVTKLAARAGCLAVISIGQCATFGGFPACVSPSPEFRGEKQTPAFGVYDYLAGPAALNDNGAAANKVINVPGCPANPWWFILTVVLWLAEAVNGPLKSPPQAGPLGILDASAGIVGGVDDQRRLKAVYGNSIHGPACARYKYAFPWREPTDPEGVLRPALYAMKPGDEGCLAMLGCKGLSTKSLCSLHGWNGQQPENDSTWDHGIAQINGTHAGGNCITGGHPCMGCTERGYPDAYVPFIARR